MLAGNGNLKKNILIIFIIHNVLLFDLIYIINKTDILMLPKYNLENVLKPSNFSGFNGFPSCLAGKIKFRVIKNAKCHVQKECTWHFSY